MVGILVRVSAAFQPWLLLAGILAGSVCGAADDAADRESSHGVLPTAGHKVQRQFSLACQAIQQQRFGEAVATLQTLVGGDVEDLFLAPDEQTATQTTVRREALKLIGSLPPEGRESYQLQFGPQAQAMLQQAAAAGDRQGLLRVSESWFHTAAGYEATLLLARDELDRGRPQAAISWLRRMQQSPAALRACQPDFGLLESACWLSAGDVDRARESLIELGRCCPGVRYRIGDREFSAAGDTAAALKLLAQSVGAQRAACPAASADWPVFRGNPARDGRGDWNGSLGRLRWQVKTFEEKDLDQVRRFGQIRGPREAGASPSVHPLVVGNLVLLRTPSGRLLAIDGKSGREVWKYPAQEPAENTQPGPFGMDPRMGLNFTLQQRLEDDVLWGQLTSDGQRVYLVDGLPWALDNPHGRAMLAGAAFNMGGPGGLPSLSCRLVALDLKREGSLVWAVGGADGGDEPKLAGAMFLGAPLPDGPQLYVLAESQGEILLCQLEASSGRLAWSQAVARPTANVFFDSVRRLAGAAPSLAEGLIVCPTSAGAVVAVDSVTHSLVWGFPYHLSPSLVRPMGRPFFPTTSLSEAPRWVDAAVIISGRRVLVAPVDSDQLYCLDLLTGEEIWSCDRSGMLYLGCVHEGRVVLVGAHEVTALRMTDRKPAWSPASLQIPSDGLSRGRGLCAGHYFYLPTSSKQLLAIDLDDGRLAATLKTDHVLGNLVGVRNCLLSQSRDLLEVFDAETGRGGQP
jgi:outer membrane protein assembly factor BamB